MIWILFILASISITHLVVESIIFSFLRSPVMHYEPKNIKILDWFMEKMKELLSCYQCSGYWVGVLTSLLWVFFCQYNIDIQYILFAFFVFGPVISLLSDLTYRLKMFLYKEY